MRRLRKHTIIIWSEVEVTKGNTSLEDLAREAVEGEAYCARHTEEIITNPEQDPDPPGDEFFGEDYLNVTHVKYLLRDRTDWEMTDEQAQDFLNQLDQDRRWGEDDLADAVIDWATSNLEPLE